MSGDVHVQFCERPGVRFPRVLGQVSPAYVAIDRHATRRLRQWLCRKHKVRTGKAVRFPADRLWSDYGLTHLAPRTASFPWAKA